MGLKSSIYGYINAIYFNHLKPQIKSGLNGIKIFLLTLGIEIHHLCMCVYISPWPKPILVVNNFPFPYHVKDTILKLKQLHVTFTRQVFYFLQICDTKNFLKSKNRKISTICNKKKFPIFCWKVAKNFKENTIVTRRFGATFFSHICYVYVELAPTIGPSSFQMKLVSSH
jgi:hypothetical protein